MSTLFFILIVTFTSQISGRQNGHYRCHWYEGPAKGRIVNFGGLQESEKTEGGQTSGCSKTDSDNLKTMVSHCTGQSLQHIDMCQTNGTWNCNAFFGVCKTLIRTEDTPKPQPVEPRESLAETCRKLFPTQSSSQQTNTELYYPNNKDCPKDANYFTLKDLSLAVLVSFITGATMLAIVIFVVWKCRNTKWESEQRKLTMLQKVQSLAALQHIVTLSHGYGSRHDAESGHFANPNYAQVIASNTLIEEMMADQDKLYEEIATLKDSSMKKKEDTLYAKVDKTKKKEKAKTVVQDDVELRDTDVDSLADDADMSNAIGSVTDSGYIEEVLDAENKTAASVERPVFTLDYENTTVSQ